MDSLPDLHCRILKADGSSEVIVVKRIYEVGTVPAVLEEAKGGDSPAQANVSQGSVCQEETVGKRQAVP